MRFLRLTEGSPRKESDIVLLAIIDDEVRFPIGEAVAVLHGDNRHDPACPLHVLASHIRERDVTNLTLLAQFSQRFYRRLEGDGVIGSVQLIDVDAVKAQTLQTPLQGFDEMLGAGIVRPLAGAWTLPSALGCDH